MGTCARPGRVKLVAGLLFTDLKKYHSVKKRLLSAFGEIDFESEPIDFHHTSYYDKEMGQGLKRAFLSFKRLLDLKNIGTVKIRTNILEKRYSKSGRRTRSARTAAGSSRISGSQPCRAQEAFQSSNRSGSCSILTSEK